MSPVVPFDVPLTVSVAGVNVGPTPVISWAKSSAGEVIVEVVMAACAGPARAENSTTARVAAIRRTGAPRSWRLEVRVLSDATRDVGDARAVGVAPPAHHLSRVGERPCPEPCPQVGKSNPAVP